MLQSFLPMCLFVCNYRRANDLRCKRTALRAPAKRVWLAAAAASPQQFAIALFAPTPPPPQPSRYTISNISRSIHAR
jgi:hypothetical protein